MEQQVVFKSLWKEDFHFLHKEILKQESKLTKAIFWAGLVQLVAILGSLIAIVSFLIKK